MGGSVRKFVNPRAYYNIERRALKKIEKEKDKPTAAPKHNKHEQVDVYSNPDPQIVEKNEKLHSRMQHLYLESYGPAPGVKSKSNRPLPQDREEFETSFDTYGYHIPNRLAQGKVDFVQMLDILKKYSDTKGEYSAADIAKDYKVDPTKMQNVLTHFQVLQVIMPKEDVEEMQTEESTEEIETTDLKSNQIAPSDSKKR